MIGSEAKSQTNESAAKTLELPRRVGRYIVSVLISVIHFKSCLSPFLRAQER